MINQFYRAQRATILIAPILAILMAHPLESQERSPANQELELKASEVPSFGSAAWREQTKSFAKVLNSNGKPPEQYIVSKFKDSDVVLFGEVHEVKENCEFVASLIQPLHAAGVEILFSEFIPSRFNSEIAEITTADTYNRKAVVKIFRQRPSPVWGYQEYMDIVESVWRFNQSLDDDLPKFRLIGIEDDWNESELYQATAAKRFKIVVDREMHMTNIIRDLSFKKKQKGLVHIGYAHTVRHGIRVAANLEKSHPGQVFQVVAHQSFSGSGDGGKVAKCLEEAVKLSKFDSVGFDIQGSLFSSFRDERSFAFKMLGKNSTLKDLAQGYVLLKPLDQLRAVTWVDGFVTEETFRDAADIAKRKKWIKALPQTAQELDQMIAKYFKTKQ